MKTLVIFLVLVAAALAQNKYTDKFDNVDIDRILQNGRVLSNYIKCMLDEGSCTAEGRELKRTLPDALSTGCSKCNQKQKTTADKVINHLRTKRPKDWDRLLKKYDPQGEFRKRYESEQNKRHA